MEQKLMIQLKKSRDLKNGVMRLKELVTFLRILRNRGKYIVQIRQLKTVKKLLGHKQIKNTMKYIGRIEFQNQDFEAISATTVKDILRLCKEGWIEYSVIKIGNVEHHCFKKPKRFSSYAQ